jgi:hypothetical protein
MGTAEFLFKDLRRRVDLAFLKGLGSLSRGTIVLITNAAGQTRAACAIMRASSSKNAPIAEHASATRPCNSCA